MPAFPIIQKHNGSANAMFLPLQIKQADITQVQVSVHGQYSASVHSIVTGAYVLPAHFMVDINKRFVPPRLWATHIAHVSCESIVVALLSPQSKIHRIIKRLVDVVKPFELIIPEHWDVILNELWCYRSGQLPPQGLT